jgi:aminoglycoside phosphotransferase (APT) family kinase protein
VSEKLETQPRVGGVGRGGVLGHDETDAVLRAALRDAAGGGADAHLAAWTVDSHFARYGKRRVVRYDLEARVAGVPRHYRWVGKFYDRDEDARRVATVLRQLAGIGSAARDAGPLVPWVLAYHAPRRFLLLTYESGESVGDAIAHDAAAVLDALGRALAALHAAPVTLDGLTHPGDVLEDLRPKIDDLCARFPGEAAALRRSFRQLEGGPAQPPPAAPAFVHGDFGPANLLWRDRRIVALDFDKCTRGDPAMDLGNLLTQLRRIAVRKPHKLRDFDGARRRLLDAYRRSSPPDAGLEERVVWYERTTLLRKIHRLIFNTTRHPGPEAARERQVEAARLVGLR